MTTTTEPRIRLLYCRDCRTLEQLSPYFGPPEYDTELIYTLENRHRFPNNEEHIGRMYNIEERVWKLPNLRKQVVDQIRGGGSSGLASVDPDYYETQNTLREDALKCYSLHLRPQADCSDWHTDRKRLFPDTAADRKELGMRKPRPTGYLCDFCPVSAYYAKKAAE